MRTVNPSQLTCNDAGGHLFDKTPSCDHAMKKSPDGGLRTQMSLSRGRQDDVVTDSFDNHLAAEQQPCAFVVHYQSSTITIH
jgi:hypothetical protein